MWNKWYLKLIRIGEVGMGMNNKSSYSQLLCWVLDIYFQNKPILQVRKKQLAEISFCFLKPKSHIGKCGNHAWF